MKLTTSILATALAVTAFAGCSNASSADKVATTTSVAAKPDKAVIDAAFALDKQMRELSKKNGLKGNSQNSGVILNLAAEGKISKKITVAGLSQTGAHFLIWDGKAQTASAEDIALTLPELEITAGKTSVCLRLATDPALFITDVPAMKEQLSQYPKASGITKVTANGTPACGHGKPE